MCTNLPEARVQVPVPANNKIRKAVVAPFVPLKFLNFFVVMHFKKDICNLAYFGFKYKKKKTSKY